MSIQGDHSLGAQIRARDGAICIYAEKEWIAHARMAVTLLTDTHLELTLTAFSTPGFTPPEDLTWEAGVALSGFRFAPDYWMGSPYLAWIIAFDPEVVESLIATANAIQSQPKGARAYALRGQLGNLLWSDLETEP